MLAAPQMNCPRYSVKLPQNEDQDDAADLEIPHEGSGNVFL